MFDLWPMKVKEGKVEKKKDPNQYHSFFSMYWLFTVKRQQQYEPNCTFIVIYFNTLNTFVIGGNMCGVCTTTTLLCTY